MDSGVSFFLREYSRVAWSNYSRCFDDIKVPAELSGLLPNDVLRPLVRLVGSKNVLEWVNTKLNNLDNKTAIELAQTDVGMKALKAFIMRIPG